MSNAGYFFDRPTGKTPVYSAEDDGDWAVAYFDLQLPITRERIEKMFQETIRNWARMKEAEGEVPTTKPMLRPGVFYCEEPDKEDYRRFYIAARFKKTRPEYIALDTASELADMGRINQGALLHEFFDQMQGRSQNATAEAVGAQHKEDLKLPDRAKEEDRAIEEFYYKLRMRNL